MDQNLAEAGVFPVSAMSQNRSKPKNSAKVYNNTNDNGKLIPMQSSR